MNDIDCDNKSLQSIPSFSGILNGNGYVIKNVKFISSSNCFGFIEQLNGKIINYGAIPVFVDVTIL